MKIVFLDSFTMHPLEVDLSIFHKLGSFISYDRTNSDQLHDRAKDAEVLLTNKTVLNEESLKKLPKLRYIGVTATGYNVVDINAARKLGITVTNARDYSTHSVAQQVFAMMLSYANRLDKHEGIEKWSSQPDFCYYDFNLFELAGKTLGLIGFGNIARKVSEIAHVFGMRVMVYKPKPFIEKPNNIEPVDLDTLLSNSDFVSLHCPLDSTNEQFMNKDNFDKMKPDGILINTARGGLINEPDLKTALEEGKIGGAYLDVLTTEPPASDHILLNVPNLKISPHIAWASLEARNKLIQIVYSQLKDFLEGKPVQSLTDL